MILKLELFIALLKMQ